MVIIAEMFELSWTLYAASYPDLPDCLSTVFHQVLPLHSQSGHQTNTLPRGRANGFAADHMMLLRHGTH